MGPLRLLRHATRPLNDRVGASRPRVVGCLHASPEVSRILPPVDQAVEFPKGDSATGAVTQVDLVRTPTTHETTKTSPVPATSEGHDSWPVIPEATLP